MRTQYQVINAARISTKITVITNLTPKPENCGIPARDWAVAVVETLIGDAMKPIQGPK